MPMHPDKRKKLEAAGYRVGDVADSLGLSEDEMIEVERRVETLREQGVIGRPARNRSVASPRGEPAKHPKTTGTPKIERAK